MLLFKKKFLPAIRSGQKTQTIRLWKWRMMRPGQRSYIPGAGYVAIERVEPVALAELTGDGKVDAVVQCAAGRRSQALMGSGDGGFVPSPRILALGSALAVADVNADLKPDLLIAETGAPLQVLLNTRK